MAKRKDSAVSDIPLNGEAAKSGDGDPPAAGIAKVEAAADDAALRKDEAPEVRVQADATAAAPATDAAPRAGAEVVSIAAVPPEGPAVTPVERARRNPLLNWLNHRVATVAVAAAVGAVAGSLVSNGVGYAISAATSERPAVDQTAALRASVSQLAGEVAALRSAVSAPETGPEAIALAPRRAAVSPEITGSVQPAGPPVAEGWVLLRVDNGRALVRGAGGHFEVIPGSNLPGLGMVQRILRQDGEWVVQTRNGVIRYRG